MTTKKAVELLKTQFYPDHHKPYVKLSDDTIHQIFQALERFEDAFEVEEIQECYDDNLDLMHELYGFNTIKIGTTQTHKVYAIPKKDSISQTNQPDWDWDISCWVYSPEYVYDKHNNKRLISDVRAELNNKIYAIPKEQDDE